MISTILPGWPDKVKLMQKTDRKIFGCELSFQVEEQ